MSNSQQYSLNFVLTIKTLVLVNYFVCELQKFMKISIFISIFKTEYFE